LCYLQFLQMLQQDLLYLLFQNDCLKYLLICCLILEWSIASGLQGIKFPCIINSRYRDIDFDDVIELDFLGEPDCLSLYC
jgi:hypothetical protein